VNYQDITGTNYTYGLLRMECGQKYVAATGGTTITFQEAFSKILCSFFQPRVDDNITVALVSESTTSITIKLYDADSGTEVSGVGVNWIAIGVD